MGIRVKNRETTKARILRISYLYGVVLAIFDGFKSVTFGAVVKLQRISQ
jgi:hypothetical protein